MFSNQVIIGLQTDDSLFSETDDYITLKKKQYLKAGFPVKPIE